MKKVINLISSLALVISMSSCAIKETPIIIGVEYKYRSVLRRYGRSIIDIHRRWG